MTDQKALHKRVVVVVEDDRPIGELLAAIINEEDGYVAVHVTRPSEALRTLEKIKPDLIVLDVSLPGMSGIELYDRIRQDERLRHVPVMFETAVLTEYRTEFQRRGITAIVEKPFDVSDFVQRVHELAPRLN
jgi:two-component system phosphate regulon response regulator OmpR